MEHSLLSRVLLMTITVSLAYFALVNKLLSLFNQPFPEDQTWSRRLIVNILIAVFIALFLYVFAPFDLDLAPGGLLRHASAYGGITLGVCLAFDLVFRLLGVRTDVPSWTLGKWVLGVLALVVAIGACNFLYTIEIGGGQFDTGFFVGMVGRTALIAFFPIVLTGMLRVRSRSAFYAEVSADIRPGDSVDRDDHSVSLFNDTGEQILQVAKTDLLFVESQKNYLLIHTRASDEPIKIRSTLAYVIDQLQEHGIMRCHRSFAVNVSAIDEVSGNAQGLRLHLADTDQIVPVSRSYVATIRAALA